MNSLDVTLAFLARQDILLLFLLLGTGAVIGRVRLGSVELGAAAVLFLGMALSAFGVARGYRIVVPEAFGTLGLVLFTFSVGNMSGPAFFASLRDAVHDDERVGPRDEEPMPFFDDDLVEDRRRFRRRR